MMMSKIFKPSTLACSVALAFTGCGGGGGGGGHSSDDGGGTPAFETCQAVQPTPPAGGYAPVISDTVCGAAKKIHDDPRIRAMAEEWRTPAALQERFDKWMEWNRIPSPSREEYLRRDRIQADMIADWNFTAEDFTTRSDGVIPASDVNIVDGKPVYNHCVEFKGTYRDQPGAVTYKGQYPKVLLESHIDVVNPESLALWGPYEPIKLQKISAGIVVETPAELAALPEELHFDPGSGKIIHDAEYTKAFVHYENTAAFNDADGYRIYVPGIGDAMANTTPMYFIAKALKDYKVKPYYDVWICGTAGEEGKGNLDGMKQLFGYDQDKGTGTNPLNFVAHIGGEGGTLGINYIGSYRYEMKFYAPKTPGADPASALFAAAAAIKDIGEEYTAWDVDRTKDKTTYTVGRAYCEDADANGVVPSCTLEVDMRSPVYGTADDGVHLLDIQRRIAGGIGSAAPGGDFQSGLDAENNLVGASGDAAVTRATQWFGDRPAHRHEDGPIEGFSNPAIQAGWQANEIVGVDQITQLSLSGGSVNNNVPAAIGVPSITTNIGSTVGGGGTHAFWEWAAPGNIETEALRMERNLTAVLTIAGYTAADGTLVPPAAEPLGVRTAEKQ
jgi:acetylornithine deacetylase/succinyl-diaminopimelate desuccinylase-like protein